MSETLERTVAKYAPPPLGARAITGMGTLSCGYLVWWSIKGNVYDKATLKTSVQACNVPDVLDAALTGEEPLIAWSKATNLKVRGVLAQETAVDCTARYTTKEVETHSTKNGARILVRERIDNAQKVVGFDQIGVLSFDGGFKFDADPAYIQFKDEVDTIVQSMATNYANRIGQIDDERIRYALRTWTEARHCIAMRKTGGIYYLPHYETLGKEVIDIAKWLSINAIGDFTSVEIYDSPGTNLDGLVASATEEITKDVDELAAKVEAMIESYRQDMTAAENGSLDTRTMTQKVGSYGYTVGMYQQTLSRLLEKVQAAEGSFGRTLGQLASQLSMIEKRADKVKLRADADLVKYRNTLGTKKPPVTAKAPAKQGKVKRQNV